MSAARRRRGCGCGLGGILLLVVLVVAAAAYFVSSRDAHDHSALPGPEAPPSQPAECPRVAVLAAPGTWESNAGDDPWNPLANPNSFLLSVTRPLQERYGEIDSAGRGTTGADGGVAVWTLPYPAQFRNPQAQQELTYDDSRTQGAERLRAELIQVHSQCPLTDFILFGFSQGAVIVGDMASEIGLHNSPIPAARVRGVALVADGRRDPAQGVHVGTPVSGVGAEVTLELLEPLTKLALPGASMRGPRPGFGVLNDQVVDICAPDDHICDLPLGVPNAVERAAAVVSNTGIHATYATNPAVFGTQTTSQWLIGWASGLIDGS